MRRELVEKVVVVVGNDWVVGVKRRKVGVVLEECVVVGEEVEGVGENRWVGKERVGFEMSVVIDEEEFDGVVMVEGKDEMVGVGVEVGDWWGWFCLCVDIKWIKW